MQDIWFFMFWFVMGAWVTWWFMGRKARRVEVVEEVVKVARCGSCNKLRHRLQSELDQWNEAGHGAMTRPPYPTIWLGRGKDKRQTIHWELMELERTIGNRGKK